MRDFLAARVVQWAAPNARHLALRLYRSIESGIPQSGPKIAALGLVGVVGFPLYYFVWRDFFPQPYENLGLRMFGCALFVPLLLVSYWPQRLRPLLPIYWYAAIWFALPFFFTFMFLKNGGSHAWGMSVLAAVFLMTLLVDWRSLIVMSCLGVPAAWVAYCLTTHPVLSPAVYGVDLAVFAFAIGAGSIINLTTERVNREKLNAMLSAANNIAHELRTPLLGIRCTTTGLRKYLPALFDAYQLARQHGLPVQEIRPAHYASLVEGLERIEQETAHSNTMIDILLVNSRQSSVPTAEFASISMAGCVEVMLKRYPFASPRERERIVWDGAYDFRFVGSELLMVHVFFNLMKNALRSVAKARKGDVRIWLAREGGHNAVYFRDTGLGIPTQILPRIFQRFYSWSQDGGGEQGTGVGLAFCKLVVESFGGRISCRSVYGAFAEFVMIFPEERAHESQSHPSLLFPHHHSVRG